MKKQTLYIILVLVFSCNSNQKQTDSAYNQIIISEDSDNGSYKILLEDYKNNRINEILAPLEYLEERDSSGTFYSQYYSGFNYPELNVEMTETRCLLFNDTIQIILHSMPFDTSGFFEKLTNDTIKYTSHYYFVNIRPGDFSFLPKNQLKSLQLNINDLETTTPDSVIEDIFQPHFIEYSYYSKKKSPIRGYIAESKNLIISIDCGEGASSCYIILLYDLEGNCIEKVYGHAI